MSSDANPKLEGTALWLARAGWIALALISIGYYIFWTIYAPQQPLSVCTLPNSDCNPFYLSVEDVAVAAGTMLPIAWIAHSSAWLNVFVSLVFVVVALLIVSRKSDDRMALFVSAVVLVLGTAGISPFTTDVIPQGSFVYALIQLLSFFGYMSPFAMLFIFPDGRFVPRWSRWICIGFLVPTGIYFSITSLFRWEEGGVLFPLALLTLILSVCIGIGCMVYRYRRVASSQQRQQIKWVAFGLVIASMSTIMWISYYLVFPPSQPSLTRTLVVAFTFPLIALLLPALPISIAIAMVRYRLWDIDILIRRTLIYSALTICLLVIYFLSVIILQRVFSALTGAFQNEIVTVLSTLAIAAMFVPLRKRIQSIMDKRFYRRKYDAQKVLQQFAETVRDETNLEKLTDELIAVVQETMQPKSASVWLKPMEDGGQRTGAMSPSSVLGRRSSS